MHGTGTLCVEKGIKGAATVVVGGGWDGSVVARGGG